LGRTHEIASHITTDTTRELFHNVPLKCDYWLTPNGVKPWRKKIDAILKMQAPTTLKLLRGFIGNGTYS
jgi:hypothetical protein